ncbi:mannose-1-phosphate guanylyltransferase/mannose-6-phosphate isomerase [Segnochrobactrum spirostomi]|uniref:mannose-1-phosphate guanylyltransferase n=1 Tax=Segnochrobactrum spirostomi TaxID=2608987 RepID=A0A6A7Y1U9_9HYPH|nr:mannose-1-phosphate guanylyltransferase/mannose-6-phosphate isomerase [Segnochrobactrum spirostomi]MQT12953.1 mannose-1-phosphate guanylyltransferase/mannose-6-phosphate isomerase [Segnochrobactrum spirostomi]
MSFPGVIVPVILAGGSGTRLWPISRDTLPKQFIALASDRSLYQDTLTRVKQGDQFAAPIVVTSDDLRFFALRQATDIGIRPRVILEPARRDSAAALLAATLVAQAEYGEDCLILALAADHVIGDEPAFHEACRVAAAAAEKGAIVTFGIEPTGPRTSYGYIRRGAALGTGAWKVEAFVEKPNEETAERYLSEGYLWNSGNFLFPAALLAAEVERFQPTIASAVREAVEGRKVDHDFIRLEKAAFERTPALSIDYAVMEHTHAAAVVEGRFPWSDVGSWKALKEIGTANEDGNVIRGPAKLVDSRNSYIHSEGPLVTALGLDDIAVIATEDAVLVMPSARSEDVKALVATLKAEQRSEAAEHIKNYRPWGTYQTALLGSRFRVKKIVVDPGARLSLQKHHHRAEHWIVVHGTAEVTVGERVFELHENQSTYIPLGELHRLANPGRIPLELIEVQTGSYLGEDDIVRLEDIYNRS